MAGKLTNTLPIIQTTNQDLMLLQTKWAAILNQLLQARVDNTIVVASIGGNGNNTFEQIGDTGGTPTAPVLVDTGTTLNITSTGNPIDLCLEGAPTTQTTETSSSKLVSAYLASPGANTIAVYLIIYLYRDRNLVYSTTFRAEFNVTENQAFEIPPSGVRFLDYAPAGRHTYTVSIAVISEGTGVDHTQSLGAIFGCQLVASTFG